MFFTIHKLFAICLAQLNSNWTPLNASIHTQFLSIQTMLRQYDTVDNILEQFIPENELQEVNRILYGNQQNPKCVYLLFVTFFFDLRVW